jgi:hypothetical protein
MLLSLALVWVNSSLFSGLEIIYKLWLISLDNDYRVAEYMHDYVAIVHCPNAHNLEDAELSH